MLSAREYVLQTLQLFEYCFLWIQRIATPPCTRLDSFRLWKYSTTPLPVRSILSSARAIDTKTLCVVPGRYSWRVFIDCVVLEASGSLLDALVLAATVALRCTRFPKLRLVQGEYPGDMDVELDDAEDASQSFAVDTLPVCLTFTQLGGTSLVDASAAEEAVADNSVSVAVNR